MISSSQIREQLACYLDRRMDLSAFEDWFVQKTWNVHRGGSVAAEQLTFAVEEVLSEYSNLLIDEGNLRKELSEILGAENKIVRIIDQPQVVYVFRSAPSVRVPLAV